MAICTALTGVPAGSTSSSVALPAPTSGVHQVLATVPFSPASRFCASKAFTWAPAVCTMALGCSWLYTRNCALSGKLLTTTPARRPYAPDDSILIAATWLPSAWLCHCKAAWVWALVLVAGTARDMPICIAGPAKPACSALVVSIAGSTIWVVLTAADTDCGAAATALMADAGSTTESR